MSDKKTNWVNNIMITCLIISLFVLVYRYFRDGVFFGVFAFMENKILINSELIQ